MHLLRNQNMEDSPHDMSSGGLWYECHLFSAGISPLVPVTFVIHQVCVHEALYHTIISLSV